MCYNIPVKNANFKALNAKFMAKNNLARIENLSTSKIAKEARKSEGRYKNHSEATQHQGLMDRVFKKVFGDKEQATRTEAQTPTKLAEVRGKIAEMPQAEEEGEILKLDDIMEEPEQKIAAPVFDAEAAQKTADAATAKLRGLDVKQEFLKLRKKSIEENKARESERRAQIAQKEKARPDNPNKIVGGGMTERQADAMLDKLATMPMEDNGPAQGEVEEIGASYKELETARQDTLKKEGSARTERIKAGARAGEVIDLKTGKTKNQLAEEQFFNKNRPARLDNVELDFSAEPDLQEQRYNDLKQTLETYAKRLNKEFGIGWDTASGQVKTGDASLYLYLMSGGEQGGNFLNRWRWGKYLKKLELFKDINNKLQELQDKFSRTPVPDKKFRNDLDRMTTEEKKSAEIEKEGATTMHRIAGQTIRRQREKEAKK